MTIKEKYIIQIISSRIKELDPDAEIILYRISCQRTSK